MTGRDADDTKAGEDRNVEKEVGRSSHAPAEIHCGSERDVGHEIHAAFVAHSEAELDGDDEQSDADARRP